MGKGEGRGGEGRGGEGRGGGCCKYNLPAVLKKAL